jgi:hypothetical protein
VARDVVALGQVALRQPLSRRELAIEDACARRGGEGVDGGDKRH